MSNEHGEYDRDVNPYPSFGKKYNGEKAVISLTSWKARINTVAKTLYSLIKQCPGFHIVLVLSEEEFPSMMNALPDTLNLFVKNRLIEVLWVYKNYKSFKKVLFTMDKYRDVPVISADDDCIYRYNYAEELYKVWAKHNSIVCETNDVNPYGYATLHPPKIYDFSKSIKAIDYLLKNKSTMDDNFYRVNALKKHIKIISLKKRIEDVVYYMGHERFSLTNQRKTLNLNEWALGSYIFKNIL